MKKGLLIFLILMLCNSNLFSTKPIDMTCETQHFLFFLFVHMDLQNKTNEDLYVPLSHWLFEYYPTEFPDNTFNANFIYFYDKDVTTRECIASKCCYPNYEYFPKLLLLKPKKNYRINFVYFGGVMFRMYENKWNIDPELNISITWTKRRNLKALSNLLHLNLKHAVIKQDTVKIYLFEWLKHSLKGILMSDIDTK